MATESKPNLKRSANYRSSVRLFITLDINELFCHHRPLISTSHLVENKGDDGLKPRPPHVVSFHLQGKIEENNQRKVCFRIPLSTANGEVFSGKARDAKELQAHCKEKAAAVVDDSSRVCGILRLGKGTESRDMMEGYRRVDVFEADDWWCTISTLDRLRIGTRQ